MSQPSCTTQPIIFTASTVTEIVRALHKQREAKRQELQAINAQIAEYEKAMGPDRCPALDSQRSGG